MDNKSKEFNVVSVPLVVGLLQVVLWVISIVDFLYLHKIFFISTSVMHLSIFLA